MRVHLDVHYPKDLKVQVKKGSESRGDCELWQDGNLVFALWQDTKKVSILSTNSQANTIKRKTVQSQSSTITGTWEESTFNDQMRNYYNVD